MPSVFIMQQPPKGIKMKKILSLAIIFAAVCAFADAKVEAWELMKKKNFAGAEKLFASLAKSGNFDGISGLMYSLRYQKKNAEVIKEADAWIAANPKITANQKASLLQFKGNALRDLGKFDEAIATYTEGLNLNSPGSFSTDCAKEAIAAANNAGKYDLSTKIYTEALKQKNAMLNVGFLCNASLLMWKTNKGEEGLKLLDTVLTLKYPPHYHECIYRYRGYIYRDCLKQYDEAVKAFEKAMESPGIKDVETAVLWNNIGISQERNEEYEKAVEAYKKVGTFKVQGWFIKSAANSVIRLQKKIDAGE